MSGLPQTPLMHLYRGELARLTVYRVRLDTTTNWAIGVTVAVTTFALGNHEAPSSLLLLPYLLAVVFLVIEARRFQELELYRNRVRLIETGWLAHALRSDETGGDAWAHELAHSLENPVLRVPLIDAVAMRVRRNYLWLLLAIYAAWWVKLWLVDPTVTPAAALGGLGGQWVILASVALMLPFPALALRQIKVAPG